MQLITFAVVTLLTGQSGAGLSNSWATAVGTTEPRYIAERLADVANVKDFGALGDGTTDDTEAIQAAVSSGARDVDFPVGVYRTCAPIRPTWNVRIRGRGPGDYNIIGGNRSTSIKPFAPGSTQCKPPNAGGFRGSAAVVLDAGASSPYIVGVSVSDITIDMTEVPASAHVLGLEIRSLTNPDTFSNIRIIGSAYTSLYIGTSQSSIALPSDGILFQNLIIHSGQKAPSGFPLLEINGAYETAFRDSKVMGPENVAHGSPATPGTMAVRIWAGDRTFSSNAVTFDGVSFTGVETGVSVENTAANSQGPRWIRVANCTFEGVRYGMHIKGFANSEGSWPSQFNTFGPGNRFQAMADNGAQVYLDDHATNNTVLVDEYVPSTGGWSVLASSLSIGNTILGQPVQMRVDALEKNLVLGRGVTGGLVVASQSLQVPSLTAGWQPYSPASRSAVGYWKDAVGVVHMQGHVTAGAVGWNQPMFQLPVGYRPLKPQELLVPANDAVGILFVDDQGHVALKSGSNAWVSLDGVTFTAGY